ncbi:OLC1v1024698C1 [Oldenlandia corymbosa var. corymbosa]|uniref:OLC1v1024698C1 n=2 Tax=Oldenlandia corymbosa var. corymbosa TaxID=529605 RepID=A0AAV1C6F2_OLDCO|nr:OLC1v1024698C1 [Oldenlandia corymbosa var. corymbosa]
MSMLSRRLLSSRAKVGELWRACSSLPRSTISGSQHDTTLPSLGTFPAAAARSRFVSLSPQGNFRAFSSLPSTNEHAKAGTQPRNAVPELPVRVKYLNTVALLPLMAVREKISSSILLNLSLFWHINHGVKEIMADYVHHEISRYWIMIVPVQNHAKTITPEIASFSLLASEIDYFKRNSKISNSEIESRNLLKVLRKKFAKMQNEEGQNMDLYIPRKCSATNRLITSKDHASVQLNIGHLDEHGVYTGNFSTFALCGFVRAQGDADSALDRLWQKKKEKVDVRQQ